MAESMPEFIQGLVAASKRLHLLHWVRDTQHQAQRLNVSVARQIRASDAGVL